MKKWIAVAILAVLLCGGCKVMGLNFSLDTLETEEEVNEAEGVTE